MLEWVKPGRLARERIGHSGNDESPAGVACRSHLLRIEASLVCAWWPDILHSLFSDHLKKTIATFRVGTWYLARRVEGGGTLALRPAPLHALRSLSWLVVSYVMPHIGLGWMAPGFPLAAYDTDDEEEDTM
jgi:hypothetical protein